MLKDAGLDAARLQGVVQEVRGCFLFSSYVGALQRLGHLHVFEDLTGFVKSIQVWLAS
jgi:hypothetical protein